MLIKAVSRRVALASIVVLASPFSANSGSPEELNVEADEEVGRLAVDDQAFLGQSAGQRNPEALAQVANEPLALALGLGPIRCAQPRLETTMPSKVEKSRMKAVVTAAIGVPLQDDRAHIVVQHLAWRPAERQKRVLVRLDQRFHPLIADKLDIGRPAPPQCRNKHRKPVAAAPNDRPVHLHLFARPGLKTDDRDRRLFRLERGDQRLQHRSVRGLCRRTAERSGARSDPGKRAAGGIARARIYRRLQALSPAAGVATE